MPESSCINNHLRHTLQAIHEKKSRRGGEKGGATTPNGPTGATHGAKAPNPGRSLERATDRPPVGATPPTKRPADMRRGSRALTPPGRGRSAPNPGDSLERAKDGPPAGAQPPAKRTTDMRRGSRALTPPGRGRSVPNQVESRPISRVLSWAVIPLGAASPRPSSNLPGSTAGHSIAPLFGLAPGGVYPATPVARSAVRSYRTLSPLPGPCGP